MEKPIIELLLAGAIGKNVLVSTNDWFFAPDGKQYKAVFGEFKGIFTDKETLGVETNAKSTNWYAVVGNLIVAGCQIYYAVLTDTCECDNPYIREELIDGKIVLLEAPSRIWQAK